MSNAKLIPFTAALALAITFIFGCTSDIDMPPNPGSTPKTDCIREGLGISANTLERIAKECGASWSEVLEQLPSSVGSCKTKDLYFDKPIKDIKSECGVEEMPIISSSSSSNGGGTFTGKGGIFKDSRDNKTYRWVQIGEQVWMAENLNYNATSSKCYNNQDSYCNQYGRLYDWATATMACPIGWHLPSSTEWDMLIDYVGGSMVAGTKLKASSGWNFYNGIPSGADEFGFAALPGGHVRDGYFLNVGNVGLWWDANEYNGISVLYLSEGVLISRGSISIHESVLSSIRCVQGSSGLSSSSSSSSRAAASSSSNGKSSSSSLAPSSSSSALPSSSSTQSGIVYGEPVFYQGETYPTVVIGTQTWMAKNLHYDVPGETDVCYGNNPANCDKYGKLYDWATAMDFPASCNNSTIAECGETWMPKHQGICPPGWHIPSDDDWNILMNFVNKDCSYNNNSNCAGAGTKLKATNGWINAYNGTPTGTDNYGFAALPGGDGDLINGGPGYLGRWWSATEESYAPIAYNRSMDYDHANVNRNYNDKTCLYSVRCVQTK
jgi:uncharacterized protein (TIGR02145 family)